VTAAKAYVWRVSAEVRSTHIDLASRWKKLKNVNRATYEILAARPSMDLTVEGQALRAWTSLLVRADSEGSARDGAIAIFEDALGCTFEELRQHGVVSSQFAVQRIAWNDGEVEEDSRFEDRRPRIVPVPWQRYFRSAGDSGVTIEWASGAEPLDRAMVVLAPESITITLCERHGPLVDTDGTPVVERLVRRRRRTIITLDEPLGQRELWDGFRGSQMEDVASNDPLPLPAEQASLVVSRRS